MENDQLLNSSVKQIRMIYGGMMTGIISFTVFAIYFSSLKGTTPPDLNAFRMFVLFANLLMLIIVPIGLAAFKNKMQDLSSEERRIKILKYKELVLRRAGMIEGCVLFCLVSYFIHKDFLFLMEALSIFGIMIFLFPLKTRILKELNI